MITQTIGWIILLGMALSLALIDRNTKQDKKNIE